jgi:hypothetical protein
MPSRRSLFSHNTASPPAIVPARAACHLLPFLRIKISCAFACLDNLVYTLGISTLSSSNHKMLTLTVLGSICTSSDRLSGSPPRLNLIGPFSLFGVSRLQFGSESYPAGVTGVCAPHGSSGGEKSDKCEENSGKALSSNLYKVTNVPSMAANLKLSGPRRACLIKLNRKDLRIEI